MEISILEEDGKVSGKPAAYIERFLSSRAEFLEGVVYTAVGIKKP